MQSQTFWELLWGHFWRPYLPGVTLLVVGIATATYALRPEDRRSLRNTVALYALAVSGLAIAALLEAFDLPAASAALREASVILLGAMVIRLAGQLIFRIVLPRAGLRAPRILEDLIVIVAYLGWGLVRLRLAGLDLSGIVATSAVITAVVAFSMQDTLGNILGGLALEMDSAFEIGDWVEIDGKVGRVVDIRWRSVSIETRNWETVIVPNSHVVRSRVSVLGRRQGRPVQLRRWVWFNVGFETPPARVLAVVRDALAGASLPEVAPEPAPNCVLMDFDQGYARYAVRYWLTDLAVDDPTDSAVRERVLAALQRAGIRLAVPEQSVHVVAEDTEHANRVRARELDRRLEALGRVDLFDELTAREREVLAQRLVPAPFAEGETITRQGAVAHWLYILTSGEVEILLERSGSSPARVATLEAPSFFGEMGLLTGEPRKATVRALRAVQCYRLDKAALEDTMAARPNLAERMSRVLAGRQGAFDAAARELGTRAEPAVRSGRSDEILAAIKRFFGLG